MSEYQYIAFRAIDAPVSPDDLEYMRKQSSRAEVTAWEFENEYHYGDFHGNVDEMLRRGYDFHFHYANFGVRKIMIRLPNGLPDPQAADAYFSLDGLTFDEDKRGPGGNLCIEPAYDAGSFNEDLWDANTWIERLLPLRAEILSGDLRPLYLASLAVATDMNHDPDEEHEPPVPAGLKKLTKAQTALAELYCLSEGLIAAAAQNSPPLPAQSDSVQQQYTAWVKRQSDEAKTQWLVQWMADVNSPVRREILGEFQKGQNIAGWPTVPGTRTITQLLEAAEEMQDAIDQKKSADAARRRAQKLAKIAADPEPVLRKSEELVQMRSIRSYEEIAQMLSDLREALEGTKRAGLAEQQAQKLKEVHPTLKLLIKELRGKRFLAR